MNKITNELITTHRSSTATVLLTIHSISEEDTAMMKGELDVFQPLIIKTQDLLPIYMENNHHEPPPEYKEHV
jgi:hypothetical protein